MYQTAITRKKGVSKNKYLFSFLLSAALLTLLGFIFIYSASFVFALERYGTPHYYVIKHFFFFLVSLAGFCFFAVIPTDLWKRYAPFFFTLSFLATAATLFSSWAHRVHGSSRWLFIGGWGFQPSDALKLFLFMYLGFLFAKKENFVHSFFLFLFPIGLVVMLSSGILLLQPDFGSVVTISITTFLLLCVVGYDTRQLFFASSGSLFLGLILIVSRSYRLRRIMIFLSPWSDPSGKGFQIIQSLIAIGSGGFFGRGIAFSQQKFFYLPMQHTDFIFSIIAEEVGFLGSSFILFLYLFFCYTGFRTVAYIKDPFAFFTSLGYVIFMSLHIVINLMVVTGLAPTKGLCLPFISFGGTFLLANFCMLGFIVGAVRSSR